MKVMFLCFALSLLLVTGCKTEKQVVKNEPITGINEQSKFSGGFNYPGATGNKATDYMAMRAELEKYNIPAGAASYVKSDWGKYYDAYLLGAHKLSPGAALYCKRAFIEHFELYVQNPGIGGKKIAYGFLEDLISNNYGGYKEIYNYLKWFKEHEKNFPNWRRLQAIVNSYAVASKPDPSKPNSEIFEQNPQFKKEMDIFVARIKERDQFIASIKAL